MFIILYDLSVGRNQILLSLCPQVFGMYLIKLAVAMVLAGGVQRMDSSGTKIRGISFFFFYPFLLYVPESVSMNVFNIGGNNLFLA